MSLNHYFTSSYWEISTMDHSNNFDILNAKGKLGSTSLSQWLLWFALTPHVHSRDSPESYPALLGALSIYFSLVALLSNP